MKKKMEKHSNVKTAVLEIRTDVRLLAELYEFFTEVGIVVTSRSKLGHECICMLNDILRENDMLKKEFTSTELARDYLQVVFGGEPNRVGRGTQAIAKQINLENSFIDEAVPEVDEDDLLGKLKI